MQSIQSTQLTKSQGVPYHTDHHPPAPPSNLSKETNRKKAKPKQEFGYIKYSKGLI